jgi:ribosome-associated toxin RatA of RatAB toxin-antitoxin module
MGIYVGRVPAVEGGPYNGTTGRAILRRVPAPHPRMKTVHKSVLIWYSAEEMFALVTDIARSPEFLPWCDHASVLESDERGMKAEIGLAFAGVRQTFVTRNVHVPGRQVDLQLVEGPFSKLDGHWRFTPVGDDGQRACKVELDLQYGFRSRTLAAVVGPVFDKIASSLVDAFVKRAEQVYK